jgi:riboflavin kinase / FMN adenylyltransferase
MAVYRLGWQDRFPVEVQGGAVSFGNFDGVHRGHADLLRVLTRWARQVAGPAVAITFDPPPVAILNPAALKPPLTTIDRRAELLHAAGANHVVVLTAEPGLLAFDAEAFIREVVQRALQARAIVEGSNFRFGRDRQGDAALLKTLESRCNIAFEAVDVGPSGISSSRVRAAIDAGDAATAGELLGRAYDITGTVVAGAQRGRTIGVPTANLEAIATLVPPPGVYAGRMTIGEVNYAAAVNIGPSPTFDDTARKVEVHLIGYSGDLYGQSLRLEFIRRLREIISFTSIDELKSQIGKDIAAASAASAAHQ